jgi:hypothetical protein
MNKEGKGSDQNAFLFQSNINALCWSCNFKKKQEEGEEGEEEGGGGGGGGGVENPIMGSPYGPTQDTL